MPLTVWITTNCGKLLKRWEHQTTWPASWEICRLRSNSESRAAAGGVWRKTMTLQWAAVATFLYTEIGLILIFCLPFIPPQRWQKIFSFSIWGKTASFWNKAFLTIITLLIVLFLDAVREVRKYSSTRTIEKSSANIPAAYEHTQMKLQVSKKSLHFWIFIIFLASVETSGYPCYSAGKRTVKQRST